MGWDEIGFLLYHSDASLNHTTLERDEFGEHEGKGRLGVLFL